MILRFRLNGRSVEVGVLPGRRLLDLLREDLGLTGTKEGCGEGECAACTVLVDGKPRLSRLTLAIRVEGKEVLTVEGLAQSGKLHPFRKRSSRQLVCSAAFACLASLCPPTPCFWRTLAPQRQRCESGFPGIFAGRRGLSTPRLLLPILRAALRTIGSPAIRAMGTLGGNIVTASPASDSLVTLYLSEARVRLASEEGKREPPSSNLF